MIEPGESVSSDPAAFPVDASESLLVSIHLPDPVRSVPFHEYALTTSFISADGDTADRTEETGAGGFPTKFRHWAFLGGLNVTASGSGGTVVAIGDSQTDGGHDPAVQGLPVLHRGAGDGPAGGQHLHPHHARRRRVPRLRPGHA
ncbi:hypothetical protein ACWD4B_24310 [Streptomyces sp. NPDC002536]